MPQMSIRERAINKKYQKVMTKLHEKYFYVEQQVKDSEMYEKYYDGEISEEKFMEYVKNEYMNFIDNNEEFYNFVSVVDKKDLPSIKREDKFEIDMKIFNFCKSADVETTYYGSNKNRLYVHNLCDLLALKHESVECGLDRHVVIKKIKDPDLDCRGEIKHKQSIYSKIYYCCECSDILDRYSAFCSVYISGVICEECADEFYDGMKIEPVLGNNIVNLNKYF